MGVAREAGLDPVSMAIAWTLTRPFPIIPIIGATSVALAKLRTCRRIPGHNTLWLLMA